MTLTKNLTHLLAYSLLYAFSSELLKPELFGYDIKPLPYLLLALLYLLTLALTFRSMGRDKG